MAPSSSQTIVGVVLLVLGILALLGTLNGLVVTLAGIGLLVYGILALLGKAKASTLVGVLSIVGGIILLGPRVPYVSEALDAVLGIAVFVVGVLLVVAGILKLMGKW